MAGFFSKLISRFTRAKIDWEELEESLVAGDLGIRLSMQIVEELQARGRKIEPEEIVDACKRHIVEIMGEDPAPLEPFADRPHVVMLVGVNGVGKTTSAAKLARHLQRSGHSVMLAAADTFRAAAIEQLQVWAERLGVPITAGQYKADPSSICYDAYNAAASRGIQFLICDTAGRLHTRHNLMEELRKTTRVLQRLDSTAPHTTLLVVDATTGSNAVAQAKQFAAAVDVGGLVVTKLDGSGKGGVVVAIRSELGLPPAFIGTGEGIDDFEPFQVDRFVNQLL